MKFYTVLFIIFVFGVVAVIIGAFRQAIDESEFLKSKLGEKIFSNPNYLLYKLRGEFLNKYERKLYSVLKQNFAENYFIFSKVRIEDFVTISEGVNERIKFGLRNKIKSRHIDFLICDSKSTKPLLAIELDGHFHTYPKQIQRDNNINKLYNEIGLPITHIAVGSNFENDIVKISEQLNQVKK